MDPEPELLGDEPVRLLREREQEREPAGPATGGRARRRRRVWWVVLTLVLVAGTIAWYADDRQRGHEADALRTCDLRLAEASNRADYRMGLTTNYVRPVAGVDGLRVHLADLMAPLARRVLPGVQRADRICKAVSVRPWHWSLVARQHAATAYSGALVTLLQALAAQGRGPFPDDATLRGLRNAAGVSGG
ncbi:MAG TPA: hypothetical protein VGK78_13095 [Nocardioides sp.]|uniref:hypothetical protein n=1 Tax=Nocardioides sp. TaxID=35761 RepID=UPI002F3E6ECB